MMTRIAIALLAAFASGCDSVTLDTPIGTPLSGSTTSKFVGRWVVDDSDVIEIREGNDGALLCGTLEWDKKNQEFRTRTERVELRQVGSAFYYFWRNDDDDGFNFLRIEWINDGEFRMGLPDPAKFRSAVEDGILIGEVKATDGDNYSVRVRAESPRIEDIFGLEDAMNWCLPGSLVGARRIKRFDEPQQAEPSDEPKSR